MIDRNATQTYIDQQLDSLCERPEMWGTNLCVELQYLMLMEFWLVSTRPDLEIQNPRFVLDEFHKFCKRAGYPANIPLSDNSIEQDEFKRLLRDFREHFSKRIPPLSPFEEHDLTVAYNLKKDLPLSESIVSQGLGNIRRVLRAAMRSPEGRRSGGRSRKEIEALTDFEIVNVDVRPRNGVGARIVVPMRQQLPHQQDWKFQAELRETIGAVVEMAEWASSSTSAPVGIQEPQKRDWIAWQTIRLIPGSDVESMELGGKLVSRSRPVILTANQRPKLLSILESNLEASEFRQTGTIRALNRDTSVLQFRAESSSRNVECWLVSPDDLKRGEQNLCAKVEVRGRLFTGIARKPVVLVEELSVLEPHDDGSEEQLDPDA